MKKEELAEIIDNTYAAGINEGITLMLDALDAVYHIDKWGSSYLTMEEVLQVATELIEERKGAEDGNN